MRIVYFVVLGLGLALAGFGVYMTQSYIGQTQAELEEAVRNAQPGIRTVEILIAARPLRYGEPITSEDVYVADWPDYAVPEGSFATREALTPDPTRPRVALRAMEAMEPILAVKVSEPGEVAGITARLTRGLRAFTIRIDTTSGISGYLRPSDSVDIYWTGRTDNQGELTRLLATGLRIIAVDQDANQDAVFSAGVPRSVTVEATPDVVAILAQGQSTGRLSLSLVGMDDTTTSTSGIEVDQRRLLGMEAPQNAPVHTCSVRTRRGAEVVVIDIPCTN
jgi:pilus assembly protein CpaB